MDFGILNLHQDLCDIMFLIDLHKLVDDIDANNFLRQSQVRGGPHTGKGFANALKSAFVVSGQIVPSRHCADWLPAILRGSADQIGTEVLLIAPVECEGWIEVEQLAAAPGDGRAESRTGGGDRSRFR